jgi:hypothetical protein
MDVFYARDRVRLEVRLADVDAPLASRPTPNLEDQGIPLRLAPTP